MNDTSWADYMHIFLDILSIVVTAVVSIWIVKTVQKKINNQRSLKDYLISELSVTQNEYRELLSNIGKGKASPKLLRVEFRKLSNRLGDLMCIINVRYGAIPSFMNCYQSELPMIIQDDKNYMNVYRNDSKFTLTPQTTDELCKFEKKNGHLFYDLVITINEAN